MTRSRDKPEQGDCDTEGSGLQLCGVLGLPVIARVISPGPGQDDDLGGDGDGDGH